MTGLQRIRRVASGLLLVGVLMVMTIAVASADSGHSKARFSASAPVQLVGPGEGASTMIEVVRRGDTIKRIKIHTENEAVFAAPLAVDEGCKDNDDGGACAATGTVLNGAGVLSVHTSDAVLGRVEGGVIPGEVLGLEYDVETYNGELRGKLSGEFVIGGFTRPVAGEARLQIKGTATYACFTSVTVAPFFVPLPDLTACELGVLGNLFLPMVLNVTDTGRFSAEPVPGAGLADPEHQLVNITGKLSVTVDANNLLGTLDGGVEISKAQAKYVDPTFVAPSGGNGQGNGHGGD